MAAMAESQQASQLPAAGALERILSAAGFQRGSALILSIAGIGFTLSIAWLYLTAWRSGAIPGAVTPARLMHGLALGMRLLLIMVAGLLGLYLALRGHRKALTRLLASSCAALSAGLGGFYVARSVAISASNTMIDHPGFQLALVAALIAIVTLMSVWIFSTTKFVLSFPKPVKVLDLDPVGHSLRPWKRGRGEPLGWRWMMSAQFMALAAGIALIVVLDREADRLASAPWSDATFYFICWSPFAAISAKQRHLGEEDRRSIRWVVLGQTAWLLVFLLAMLAVYAFREAGVLAFANWSESERFAEAFFGFFFSGFVLILILTLGFSILYHGTLDPDLMIRRTWFLGVFGLFSGVLFVLIERLLAGAMAASMGMSTANALTLVAIVTAVVVFPLRSWLEGSMKRAIDRWQSVHTLADGARRDAVIVFADLSGYTALTERNEREALIMAAVFHRDAQSMARAHRGQLIKTIGDAAMLRFESADDAYQALSELQRSFRAHIEPMSLVPLPIHAAIHRGEVVEGAGGDVFGATVNLAARLLGAAGPNEIVASMAALDRTSLGAHAHSLGEKRFRNVGAPVECFRLA